MHQPLGFLESNPRNQYGRVECRRWLRWKVETPPDLHQDMHLMGVHLMGVHFIGVHLMGIRLTGMHL
jgi:hypothetical protein